MVEVTLIMKKYQWTFEGQLHVTIDFFVNKKNVATKGFLHPIGVSLQTIMTDARQYAHTILGYKQTAEALNLEQYIGVPFTEEV